jgi:DNA-binding NarL/FixJ family response regulator
MQEPKLRVLIADDDPLFLSALELALTAWHEIEVVAMARDGSEAVELFAATRPDVAIVDLSMPRGDGIDVTARVRELDDNAIVLILSSTDDVDSLTKCLGLGARGCLRKGADYSQLGPLALAASGAVQPELEPRPS